MILHILTKLPKSVYQPFTTAIGIQNIANIKLEDFQDKNNIKASKEELEVTMAVRHAPWKTSERSKFRELRPTYHGYQERESMYYTSDCNGSPGRRWSPECLNCSRKG